jgi:eukaryotic-like serine/threonine-protein kinase
MTTSNGRLLGGRYRLERRVGCGGMASVWEADDQKLARRVAVKVLLGRHSGKDDASARFERETRAVARLRSPHIVQVFDYGVDGGRPYMVMELLGGETLSARLRRTGRLTLARAAVLAQHIGKALATAHEVGIIHRDLKPGNVFLVDNHGEDLAKIFDFGISKALSALHEQPLTHDDLVLGTPRFMSPEQLRESSRVDARADLWSFGVLLYLVCTGRLPFDGPNLKGAIQAVVNEPAPSVRGSVEDGVADELDAFFARALAKDPRDRFATALSMAEAFDAVASPVIEVEPEELLDDAVEDDLTVAEPSSTRDAVTMVISQGEPSPARRWALPVVAGAVLLLGALALGVQHDDRTAKPAADARAVTMGLAATEHPQRSTVPTARREAGAAPAPTPAVERPKPAPAPERPKPSSAPSPARRGSDLFEEPW